MAFTQLVLCQCRVFICCKVIFFKKKKKQSMQLNSANIIREPTLGTDCKEDSESQVSSGPPRMCDRERTHIQLNFRKEGTK